MKPRFDLYFAGYYSEKMEQILKENNFNQLLSYVNEIKKIPAFIEAKRNGSWKGKLLIDSGAFSIHKSGKTADVDKYISWINENHDGIDYYIQLDDIPGKWGQPKTAEQKALSPVKTWENYLYMRSKLIEPRKLLPVYHQGEDFKFLRQMLEYKDEQGLPIDYICISSNKELSHKTRLDWYKRCYEEIERSHNPNIKVHSLGTQSETHCEMLPFTSVDATSWIMTGANGNIYTEWGSVTVSDRQLGRKENINNKLSYNIFKEYVESKGTTVEKLASDNNERIAWNMLYLGNWAKDKREYKGPKSFKKGRLF